MDATDTVRRCVSLFVLVMVLIVTATGVGSVAALRADSGSTYASPSAPGATATYTATVVAERGDALTNGGLSEIGLNFAADSDFSGSLANVTARDVTVRVRDGRTDETDRVGPVRVAANATRNRVWIGLESAYREVEPGDEIVVEIANVTNTEIAINDPNGPRGFALNVSVANPQGTVDGPVKTRYSIDPNARATGTTQATPNTTAAPTATTGATPNGTARETGTQATMEATGTAGSGTEASASERTRGESSATTTATESTETSGPGFGVVVGVVAVLAIGVFVARRR